MERERKLKTSFSISPKCKLLLQALSRHLGISQASVIEMLVREKARVEKINAGKTN